MEYSEKQFKKLANLRVLVMSSGFRTTTVISTSVAAY